MLIVEARVILFHLFEMTTSVHAKNDYAFFKKVLGDVRKISDTTTHISLTYVTCVALAGVSNSLTCHAGYP